MFIRLSLLRIHHRHSYHQNCYYYHGFLRAPIIAWPKTNGPSSNVMLWHRHRCDIKQNEELLLSSHAGGRVIIPTPLKIKQSIKSGFYDLIDGHTCIQTVCPTCPASTESSDATGNATTTSVPNNASSTATDSNFADQAQTGEKCLFINKTTGDVICSKCQYIFSFSAIEKFFTKSHRSADDLNRARDLFLRSKPKPTYFAGEMMHKNAQPVRDMDTDALRRVMEFLGMQKIDASVLQGLQAFCHEKRNTLYFPMLDIQSNIVGYKKLHRLPGEGGGFHKMTETTIPAQNSYGAVIFPPMQKRGLRDPKTAIIVLNMLDALALRMEKTNLTIICLPYGFKHLPQECLPLFEPYSKLILWFDYNSIGWDMAKLFAKKLEERRCQFIRPTDDSPTPYSAMQRAISIKTILSSAQPIVHKAVTTFRSLRQDVLSDLQNMDKVQGIKWKRYPVLNRYLKGHRRGELTVLTGPTGCGKTTFMAEYSLDLAIQGVNTLWGSFEIRNTLLARTLLQQMARKPLDEHLEEFDQWANQFEQLPMYFMTFYGQQPLKVVMEAIEHSQYVHDIHHVIIDNLQFMMGTGSDPRNFDKYWKQDEIIAAFRTFATRRNCHVTLVIHPRKERNDEDLTINSIFGSAKATQEADNVLIIQDKRLISIKGKKYLQIAKNRHTGDLGIMMLEFDRDALSYAPKESKK